MPYSVHSVSENVIFQIVTGEYLVNEMASAVLEMTELVDAAQQDSYLIVDLSKMKSIETNVVLVRNAVKPLMSHKNIAFIVAYGSKDLAVMNFLVNIMTNLFKIRVKMCATQAEAIEELINQDPSLKAKLEAGLQNG